MRVSLLVAAVVLAGCRRAGDGSVAATGTVEVVETDVAALVPARVVRVWPHEGAVVHAGDTLVSLTQSVTRSDIAGRQARLASAEAQLRELIAGPRAAEIQRAEADLRSAQAEATRAADDLARLTGLAQSGTISKQQFDAARAAAAGAAGRRDAAAQSLTLLREGARPEQIAAARGEVANARAALQAAEQTASDLVLLAPTDGLVMSRNVEPGDVIGAGVSAMTIGDVSRPYVRVYVGENVVPRLHVGDTLSGFLDGFPGRPFGGRIEAIADKAEYTPRVALTKDERADLVFGVKVAFTDTSGMLKAGLPITVHFSAPPAGRQ